MRKKWLPAVLIFAEVAVLTSQAALAPPEALGKPLVSQEYRLVLERYPYRLSSPWSLAFLPDGRALVTERGGRLLLLDGARSTSVVGLPSVRAAGQGGLLDIALHPRFEENRLVYLSFSAPAPSGASTALFRGVLAEGGASPRLLDGRILWREAAASSSTIHYGSRILFDAAGFLYLSTGERGDASRARDLSDGQGKVLRFHDDGSVPADNPFVGRSGARSEIWSYGHRNPQGMALGPLDGLPWLSEHGPMGGDEINVLRRGGDYGWDMTTYGRAYSGAAVGVGPRAEGVTEPVLHWTPSIAPSGLAFVEGPAFTAWKGNLLSGALAGKQLRRIVLQGEKVLGQEVLLKDSIGRIRDVRMGADGLIYLLTDGDAGSLYRLSPLVD